MTGVITHAHRLLVASWIHTGGGGGVGGGGVGGRGREAHTLSYVGEDFQFPDRRTLAEYTGARTCSAFV